jgi:DNA-binding response OmpR family regulator
VSRQPKQVLVVDDEPAARTAIEIYLRHHGYAVSGAADGQEALESLRQNAPDLIILDLAMPRLDGVDFLRALRRKRGQRLAQVPVIVTTCRCDALAYRETTRLGVEQYMVKTRFTLSDLLDAVNARLAG